MELLTNSARVFDPNAAKTKIPLLNPTRWVDRHSTLIAFDEMYQAIVGTLRLLEQEGDDVGIKAENLLLLG